MRLRTLVVFAAGYLWGTRAGPDRYREYLDQVRGFLDSELVRDFVGSGDEGSEGSDVEDLDDEEDLDEGDFEDEEDLAEPDEDEEDFEDEEDLAEEEPDGEEEETGRVRRRAPARPRR